VQCNRRGGERFTRAGRDRQRRQLHRCAACGRRLTERSASAFSGYRFVDAIIALAVRWYLRFRVSYVDLAELLAERGVTVDPSTLYDWVQVFTPRFVEAARAHRCPVTTKWYVDETLLKIGKRWRYVFRAIDGAGQVVDVYRSEHRDRAAAQTVFEQALTSTGVRPSRVTPDKATCYPPALRAVLPQAEHRTSKFLNNRLEMVWW
jgi:transposase-like protein